MQTKRKKRLVRHSYYLYSKTDRSGHMATPENERRPTMPAFPADGGSACDEDVVEATRWMITHHPEFFASYSLEQLRPDVYPEHRVIAEYLQSRKEIQDWLSGIVEAGEITRFIEWWTKNDAPVQLGQILAGLDRTARARIAAEWDDVLQRTAEQLRGSGQDHVGANFRAFAIKILNNIVNSLLSD